MTIWLCPAERYRAALKTFDPLASERLFQNIDPVHAGRSGQVPWVRVLLFGLLIFSPAWLFCAIPSPTFGGHLLGQGGMAADIGVYTITFFGLSALILIPIGRRLLGDLINELIVQGRVDSSFRFSPKDPHRGHLLRLLEWASRLDRPRTALWLTLVVAEQAFTYLGNLRDNIQTWPTSPVAPGSLMYALRFQTEQPTFTGLWFFLIFGPVVGYLVVVAARLMVLFACLCSAIAREDPRIAPSHPDGTGGLHNIGVVALFFSLFTFAVGIDLAGVSINRLIILNTVGPDHHAEAGHIWLIVISWCAYLIVGSLLFFLPLVPLRARMAHAKRKFLLEVFHLHAVGQEEEAKAAEENRFDANLLQGMVALDSITSKAAEMPVWPFDRKTFARYAGVLVAPLAPLFADRLPELVIAVRNYLGLAK